MKKFIADIKKYFYYSWYAAKSELKTEVANSYLNWFWWILDPLAFMLIYSFITIIVFGQKMPYFPVFVFLGLSSWNFFNWMMTGSVKLIITNRDILSKIYIPKYILLFQKSFVYLFKTMISLVLVAIVVAIYKIPLTIYVLNIIPLFILLYILSFATGLFLMHFGVYVEDLQNLTTIVLKMLFYMSGIFYNIDKIKLPPHIKYWFINLNPIAFIVTGLRRSVISGTNIDYRFLFIWYAFSIILLILGVKLIQKNENTYAKVI